MPAFILEQELAASGPARRGQRNQSDLITRYPPAPRQQRPPQPLGAPGVRASSAACFPPKVTAKAPPAPQGRSWPGRGRARGKAGPAAHLAAVRLYSRWPRPPGGRRCGGAGLRQGQRGAGSHLREEGSVPPRPARRQLPTRGERSESAYPFWRAEGSWAAEGYARQPASLCDFNFSLPLRSNGA